jgi:antitoxin (DNA-binding transcriptional repressor) of toxin-antitoxin stability system
MIIRKSDLEIGMTRITATEAARNFSDLLNRVEYKGESFEITRGKQVVAQIVPTERKKFTVGDMKDLLDRLPPLDKDDAAEWEEQLKEIRASAKLPDPKWD